ncbi:MAG: SGNH/GDSL hydrolase family protein [Saprospiraceae bacterium]|nr:SGNH/GDSL hydrolase family protein [Saprospiraceae bacterium]
MLLVFGLMASALLLMCQSDPSIEPPEPAPPAEKLDILALGDSYTKGESVPWANNFPNQLADSLKKDGREVSGVRIIAQTGWRTDNLRNAIEAAGASIGDSTFSIVTLCIGVNNQYQGGTPELYQPEFEALLQMAIERAGGRKERVFVLSIPDWAFTPYGQNFGDPAQTSQEIDQFNAINRAVSLQAGVQYLDVTAISRMGLDRPVLVASDGLHPSAQQYKEWVTALLPAVRASL